MKLIICISDFWQKRTYLQISCGNNNDNDHAIAEPASKDIVRGKTLKRLQLLVDGVDGFYLLRELQQFTQFNAALLANPALRGLELLWLQLVPAKKEIIDFRWNRMLAYSLWEKIEMEYLMSWLSTLGGGFSALGEQFGRCAETAGKISLKQLTIGLRLGDPFLQARCKLYYSLSLIQTGRLRAAKHIVREQYKFAKRQQEIDGRLVKMCKGIWLRIQYEYSLRLRVKEIERQKHLLMGAGDK